MENKNLIWEKIITTTLDKIIGYILLLPPLASIWQLAYNGFFNDWTGAVGRYTATLPLYFGLMALAGAYLIKDKK